MAASKDAANTGSEDKNTGSVSAQGSTKLAQNVKRPSNNPISASFISKPFSMSEAGNYYSISSHFLQPVGQTFIQNRRNFSVISSNLELYF